MQNYENATKIQEGGMPAVYNQISLSMLFF